MSPFYNTIVLVTYVAYADPSGDSVGRPNLDIPIYRIQSDHLDVCSAFDFTEHLTPRATREAFAVNNGVFCNSAFYGFWAGDGIEPTSEVWEVLE
jgi:hypothetical protein